MATSIVQFRIDDNLKAEATAIYERLGIDLSTAMRMFLKRSVAIGGIPFSMILPPESFEKGNIMQSVAEMNKTAEKYGITDMSLADINAEITKSRTKRRNERGTAE